MNKTVQMKDIYNIFSKYGDINIKVNTPYGYKKILDCDITAKNSKVIKTKVESGLFIETSPGHLLKTKNGRFKKVSEFQPGSYIKTKNGNEKIKSIEYLKDKKDLYDIQVEDVKQYYSNGIISHNSALLDSLSFCLFDTSARAFKADRVLNNKKGSFICNVCFEIDEAEYFIERKGKRLKNGHVKVDVDFWTIDDSGEKISLNGDQRRTTNLNIRRIIGSYDDFILTALSLQNNSTVFIDKTQKERKDLLAQFMGMGIFDQLYTVANENVSDISAILKDFNKTDYDVELSDIEKGDIQYKDVREDLRDQKKILTNRRAELNEQVLNLTKKLRPIDESITDIDKLNEDKDDVESQLDFMDNRLGTAKTDLEENKSKISEFKNRITDYTSKNVNDRYHELSELEDRKNESRIEIDQLKIEVRNKLDKIEKLGNLEWDDNCDYCMSNPFTLDAMETKEKLNEDKQLASECIARLDNIEEKIRKMGDIHSEKVDFDRTIEALKAVEITQHKLESEKTLLVERKKNTLNKIFQLEEKIQKYHESKNDIVYNKQLEDEIETTKNTVDDLDYQVDIIDKKIQTIHGEIKINQTKKKAILETMNKVENLETEYEAYGFYMDAVKRDGIPYELIEKALPTIEGEVNDILSQMVEFGIVLEMDGKNINTYLAYDEDNVWPLELSSGMERFVSSLAIRVGLINVCNLPRANFLAIDEGFGNMDSDNLNSVYMLFQYLKSQFQFAFIVSHIESMRDTVDSLLEISKVDGCSQLKLPVKFK
ncbi:hypothetical protein H8D04_01615 [bacterium]|nr:hypothetical protein [bacterium]